RCGTTCTARSGRSSKSGSPVVTGKGKSIMLFSDQNALNAYFRSVDRQLNEKIASRPADLRLPHKGCRFRAIRNTVVDVATYLRSAEDLFIPIEIQQDAIPQGEIIRLEYDPDPSESTHCSLVP